MLLGILLLQLKIFKESKSDMHRRFATKSEGEKSMKRSIALLTIAVAALFLVFASSTPVALAEPQPLLTHHVREVTLNGEAPSVGRLPANQSMRIDIVLAVRDQAGLDR